jgi:hypothetical protein
MKTTETKYRVLCLSKQLDQKNYWANEENLRFNMPQRTIFLLAQCLDEAQKSSIPDYSQTKNNTMQSDIAQRKITNLGNNLTDRALY